MRFREKKKELSTTTKGKEGGLRGDSMKKGTQYTFVYKQTKKKAT